MSGSLPTFATSPNTCGVQNLLQSGSLFSTTLTTDIATLLTSLEDFSNALSVIPESILNQLGGFNPTDLISDLQTVIITTLSAFLSHVNGLISNMVPNLSVATSALSAHLGLMNSGCGLPTLAGSGATPANPYPAMQVFFASILGTGASMIASIQTSSDTGITAVESLYNAQSGQLQGIGDSIISYVASISAVGVGISNMTNSETNAFATVATDMLNFASATSLLTLYNNPCAALVINAVASEALLAFLG